MKNIKGTLTWLCIYFERIREWDKLKYIEETRKLGFEMNLNCKDPRNTYCYLYQMLYFKKFKIRYSSKLLVKASKVLGPKIILKLI